MDPWAPLDAGMAERARVLSERTVARLNAYKNARPADPVEFKPVIKTRPQPRAQVVGCNCCTSKEIMTLEIGTPRATNLHRLCESCSLKVVDAILGRLLGGDLVAPPPPDEFEFKRRSPKVDL